MRLGEQVFALFYRIKPGNGSPIAASVFSSFSSFFFAPWHSPARRCFLPENFAVSIKNTIFSLREKVLSLERTKKKSFFFFYFRCSLSSPMEKDTNKWAKYQINLSIFERKYLLAKRKDSVFYWYCKIFRKKTPSGRRVSGGEEEWGKGHEKTEAALTSVSWFYL